MDADSALFLGFNLDAWITIATVLVMFSVLLFTKLRSDLVFFLRIGLPMNLIILAANILIVNIVYPLTPLQ